jgi:hypothetical protein
MVLRQEGQRVTGCYGLGADDEGRAGDATVEGIVEDGIFLGTWVEHFGKEHAPARGTFAFALTPEGELSGVWGNDASGKDRTSRWEGTPKEGPARREPAGRGGGAAVEGLGSSPCHNSG